MDYTRWHLLAWLVGLGIWLALRPSPMREQFRQRAASWSATLGLLWFGVGAAARVDAWFRDLFVYFGLSVNACMLVDVFARSRTLRNGMLCAITGGLALVAVLSEWPIDRNVSWSCFGWLGDWRTLIDGMLTSHWLPWCSRSLFRVALAGMAMSASSAIGLAAVAWSRSTPIKIATGLLGAFALTILCALAEADFRLSSAGH